MSNATSGTTSWLARFQAALLIVVVLNVSVAPCAMAFDEGRHCPNCPPERDRQTAPDHGNGHHGHGHHGDQGVEPVSADCESLKAQCADLDESNVDVRSWQSEIDSPLTLVTAPYPIVDVSVPRSLAPPATGPPPDLCRGSPRLHELNCVYRD